MTVIMLRRTRYEGRTLNVGDRVDTNELVTRRWLSHGIAMVAATPRSRLRHTATKELVSIVIPVHNQVEHLRRCLDSLEMFTPPESFELILVNDGSDQETTHYMEEVGAERYIKNATAQGFPRACNQGILNSQGEVVILLNSDTILTKGWLPPLRDAALEPKVAAAGPTTNYSSGKQCDRTILRDRGEWRPTTQGDGKPWSSEEIAEVAAKYTGQPTVAIDDLSGFCMAMSREAIDQVGGLDVCFGLGGGEEKDWERRALARGYAFRWARSSYVHHVGHQTLKGIPDWQAMGQKNHQLMLKMKKERSPEVTPLVRQGVTPVLMLTWDRLAYTEQALPALLETPGVAVFVYDDGSTDGTREYLESIDHPALEAVLFRRTRQGVDSNMDRFFSDTKGAEWLGKVDNDTVVPRPSWLTDMTKVAGEYDLAVVGADHALGSQGARRRYFRKGERTETGGGSSVWLHPFVGGSGVVIRRKLIEALYSMGFQVWRHRNGVVPGGWSHFQFQATRLGYRIAFYDGVYVNLLDMAGDGVRVQDYPEYNKSIHQERTEMYASGVTSALTEVADEAHRTP